MASANVTVIAGMAGVAVHVHFEVTCAAAGLLKETIWNQQLNISRNFPQSFN